MNWRKPISLFLACLFVINIIGHSNSFKIINTVEAAPRGLNFTWDESHTLDNKLDIINVSSKYYDDEVLFKWDFSEEGTYKLKYNITDNREMVIEFDRRKEQMDVSYFVNSITSTGGAINITPSLTSTYQEINYNKEPIDYVLEPKTPTLSGDKIIFNSIRNTDNFVGKTFWLNGRLVRFLWKNDNLYFYTNALTEGALLPFHLTHTSLTGETTTEDKNVLVKLSGFEAKPTHYINNTTEAEIINMATSSGDNERPGGRPGIDLSFDHPKVWDNASGKFINDTGALNDVSAKFVLREYGKAETDEETGESLTTEFKVQLNQSGGLVTGLLADSNGGTVTYNYKAGVGDVPGKYTIKLVKTKSLDSGGSLGNSFLEWGALKGSRIYETDVYFTPKIKDDNEFTRYIPKQRFSNTYLEYKIKRESLEDAYLEVVPYQGIRDDVLNYDVYLSREKDYLLKEKWLTYTHEITDNKGQEHLYIPVKFESVDNYYKIEIRFDGQLEDSKFTSQTIKYKSQDGEVVPPAIPNIIKIDNKRVIPSTTNANEPDNIMFDLTFKAPSEDVLEKLLRNDGVLYYELLINQEPGDLTTVYAPIKVFEVRKNTEGQITVNESTSNALTGGTGSEASWLNYTHGYNSKENKFKVENITLKNSTEWIKTLTLSSNEQIEKGQYDIGINTEEYEGIKDLPNINFLKMRAVSVYPTLNVGEYSGYSVAKSFSLNTVNYELPTTDHLQYENIIGTTVDSPISGNLSFDFVNTRDYENYMLSPTGTTINGLEYEIFISQDRNKMIPIEDATAKDITEGPSVQVLTTGQNQFDFNSYINEFRNGKIIRVVLPGDKSVIDGRSLINLINLDNNQVYYITIRTKVNTTATVDPVKLSKQSKVLSITTNYKSDQTIDENKPPLIPDNFIIDNIISNSTIKLKWNINMKSLDERETIGYELVRLKNNEMSNKFGSLTGIGTVLDENSDAIGFRVMDVDGNGFKSYRFNRETGSWDVLESHVTIDRGTLSLIDDSLEPNTVYYYYLRAVRVSKDTQNVKESVPKSLWTGLTYTSKPLNPPINVTIDYSRTYDYDDKKEAVIYFDMAIPDVSTINYEPLIYLYSQDDFNFNKGYKLADNENLMETNNGAPEGYKRYYYKVKGLKPGKQYSLKVKIQVEGDASLFSSFSKVVIIRTEFDEDDYDREHKLNNYLAYYDDEASKLGQNIFWSYSDTKDGYSIKYRKYYTKEAFEAIPQSVYDEFVEGHDSVSIYFPQGVIDSINNSDIEYTLHLDKLSLAFGSGVIDKTMIDSIRKYADLVRNDIDLKDYYLKLTIKNSEYKSKVNFKDPVSPMLAFSLEVVGIDMYDSQIDNRIETKLTHLTKTHRVSLETKLIDTLNEQFVSEEDMIKVVQEEVKLVKSELDMYAKSTIDLSQSRKSSKVYELSGKMSLKMLMSDANYVQLYHRQNNTWAPISTEADDAMVYGKIQYMGEYIFTGAVLNISEDIDSTSDLQVSNIVNKYRLTNYYLSSELNDQNALDQQENFYYSIATLLGVPQGEEQIRWLSKNNIINVRTYRAYAPITQQEAIIVITKAYGYKHNVDLNAIRVQNYYALDEVEGIMPRNKDILLKAYTIGIINLDNDDLEPMKKLTIEEAFEYYNVLENGVW